MVNFEAITVSSIVLGAFISDIISMIVLIALVLGEFNQKKKNQNQNQNKANGRENIEVKLCSKCKQNILLKWNG